MKKSNIIQEIVNVFPSWSRVRHDDQSVGQQALNPIALQLERMEQQLALMRANQYLTTANLDDMDLVYKTKMAASFEFDTDDTDPLFPVDLTPSVSGLQNGTWYPISEAEFNDIESFWYTSVPNRISAGEVVSGIDVSLVTLEAQDSPVTGIWEHHLSAGRIWVETVGGTQYLTFEQDELRRGKVILKGKTRKGTLEEETLIFPWDMKQPAVKEWKTITEVSAFDIEDTVDIYVKSADFVNGPYLSEFNLRYSENRNKIDVFWDVGHNGTIPTLDRLEYTSDEWQQLVLGFSDTDVKESWELLDDSGTTISGVDLALQPFTNHAWVVTSDGKLLLYDVTEETVSGFDDLRAATPGAHIKLDFESDRVLLGENIIFVPWHARPLKELKSYRIWYQRPDGQKFGLLSGSSVSYTSDFTVKIPSGTKLDRTVEDYIYLPTTMRGEYLVVFEGTFVDDEEQEARHIFTVNYKDPLVELDISTVVSGTPDGIEFDADQKLWIRADGNCYEINLHTDVMLVDYENKTFYFKEDYEEVGIETDG